MAQMTHERCSELLRSFQDGRLSAAEAADVEAHLSSCEECSQEHAGLNPLLGGDPAALTDNERTRLRAGIAAAIAAERRSVREVVPMSSIPAVRPSPPRVPRSRSERLWPGLRVLAAAAVVVAGFVFASTVLPGGGDDATTEADQSGAAGGLEAAPDAGGGADGPAPIFAQPPAPEATPSDATEIGEDERTAQAVRSARPAAPYSRIELRQLGRTQKPFTEFAASYTVEDADQVAEPFLEQLATAAPNDEVASAVRTCGKLVLEADTTPVVPAFAAYDMFDGEQSLILGFVSSSEDSDTLDQYQVWVWADTDCELQTYYASESIRTRG